MEGKHFFFKRKALLRFAGGHKIATFLSEKSKQSNFQASVCAT